MAVATSLVLLLGCGTSRDYRSADLSSDHVYKKHHSRPQLLENDVLGLKDEAVTDKDIQRILDETRSLNVTEGATLLVVQSGANHPDEEMLKQLSKHFTVIPYTGVPDALRTPPGGGGASTALRLAAAHAKAETILVYWAEAEMKRDDLPTGIVSWVPVVDFVVPDEYQKVRLQVKVALIDVRTGQWATFRTEPVEDQSLTTRYAREKAPEWPVAPVKVRAYKACVRKLVDGYVARQ